jgi:membrane fusion protein (multidrug efflux system)
VTVEVLRETRKQAMLVPREAVIRELQETFVFEADGKVARKRAVAIGLEEAGRIEVTGGLKAGEQVIVSGQGGLKEGAPIAIGDNSEPAKKG